MAKIILALFLDMLTLIGNGFELKQTGKICESHIWMAIPQTQDCHKLRKIKKNVKMGIKRNTDAKTGDLENLHIK